MIYADFASREDIEKVIYDDEIYDRISDDDSPPKEYFKIPYGGGYFIGGYINGRIASLFIVHDEKLHFMVLRPYRRESRKLLMASFGIWPYRVYCVIPSLYRPVINFAKRFGFVETNIEKAAHKKHGCLYDNHTLVYEV